MHLALVRDSADAPVADEKTLTSPSAAASSSMQHKKHMIAGVGQLMSFVVLVVALAFAVLASNPLDWKNEREKNAGDINSGTQTRLQDSGSNSEGKGSEGGGGEDREAIEAFVKWFEASGGIHHEHIGITEFPHMGNGIIALHAISEHDQLLFVPMDIIICRETIVKAIPASLETKFKQLVDSQDELLTAFLLLEMLKETDRENPSLWRPYLKLLPKYQKENLQAAGSPLFFKSDADVNALQDERMVVASHQERKLAKRAFKKFQRLFKALVSGGTSSSVDLGLYSHARFLVSSRAFTIKGQRYLVPFGDVFNGKSHESARKFDNGQRFLQYHALKDNGVLIRADRSIAAGGQVFEDYGDNNNYVYFLHHGFLMPDNPFDCASLRLPKLEMAGEEERGVLDLKMQVLSHYGVENGPISCVMRDGRISQENLEVTQFYMILFNTDAETMQTTCGTKANYANCFLSTTASLFVSAEEDNEFAEFMVHAIDMQLINYATSLDEDLEILRSESAPATQHSAIAFRISRKQILHDVLSKLQTETAESQDFESEPEEQATRRIGSSKPTFETLEEPTSLSEDPEPATSRIDRFRQWIESQNLPINHLELKFVGDAMGYGTFATKPLHKGEIYLSVPEDMAMNLRSASKSKSLRRLVQKIGRHAVVDDTLLLVLHLLDEKFGPNSAYSRWKPYLDVLPSIESMEKSSPLFYGGHVHMELLRAADVHSHVASYRDRVSQAYHNFQLQLKNNKNGGGSEALEWITEQRFRYANAILDSRTIWWSGQRHLVPLLDMVNCLDLGPGHTAHRTALDTTNSIENSPVAVTKASWDFGQGDQVVENYAQPNYIYLLYHGFVLDSGANKHDCAHFSLNTQDRDTINSLQRQRKRTLMEMIEALDLKTWTPELCVDPSSEPSVLHFARVAFITETPLHALEAVEQKDKEVVSRQVRAGLGVVANRLQALEDGLGAERSEHELDNQSQVIFKYLKQQHELMTSLRFKLQGLQEQQ